LGRNPLLDKAKMLALGLVSVDEPKSYRETVCSGIDRLRGSRQLAERLFGRVMPSRASS
jgi:hypothetical protein